MMTLNDFIKETKNANENVRPRVVCTDGFSISIQASHVHYCEPRQSGLDDYSSFELGYSSEFEPLLDQYAEDHGVSDTVFGWVPKDVVESVLQKHGGIDHTWKYHF